MSRISIQSLSKSFGGRDLFQAFSLEVTPGMRLAVVGPNGCGKSTFLRILAGIEDPDSGQVSMPKDVQLGYSKQELTERDLGEPVTGWVMEALPSWGDFWERWDTATRAGDKAALAALAQEQAHLEHVCGYNPEHKARAVLSGLGFSAAQLDSPLRELSGGWRERAKLARILVEGAGVLLLDEPTNHLDLEAVEWLEDYLNAFEGALVFVAHDRMLLDRVSTHVLFLGGVKPVVRKGTFTQFWAWMDETEEQRRRAEQRVQDDIAKKMDFVRRFQVKATKARQANSMKKQVAKLEKELEGVRAEPKAKELKFSWPAPERGNKTVLSAIDVQVAYSGGASLWRPLDFHIYAGQKIALAGPNGCGKTTLLRAITGQLAPSAGSIEVGSKMRVGYFSQHQAETLNLDRTVLGEIRRLSDPRSTEEELRSVLGLFMLPESFWDREVRELSGGEKNRLILATLFLRRANFLVLDEPTNHLDLESRDALIKALGDYEGTILMVAHDRHLMSAVAREVWWLKPEGIEIFPDGFQGYDRARRAALEPACAPQAEALRRGNRADAKEAKRRQAEARNALYKKLRPLQERYAAKEAELEKLLAEQGEVEQTLADPGVYADAARSSGLMKRFAELQGLTEKLMERMDALEGDIAALEAEREALGDGC
ncbi:ribosomal protection-like ABC-F family protein [Desulfocurvus sp.]|jgi:ATP-binding cassette subfamily F protein 3|uniref:ribosomal protection-like ABC-F family protein n=1 Tax=Desulfocurvus sp. TaxID=2871698 RepID=UPI0025C10076|nr:ABC-F family ATP-binding cassette domain-containing protein [Desulfocurvus sp.]MCK9239662.1 ABC-F family ATP-binding cassette domain-containing protein [Desulfocurvus sp.]